MSIEDQIAEIARTVVREEMGQQSASLSRDVQAEETYRVLERIKAKDFISPNEAGLLFGCSPQHLRNQVEAAIAGNAICPIPFCDLAGVVVFPVNELLAWSRVPKPKVQKRRQNKTRLQAVLP